MRLCVAVGDENGLIPPHGREHSGRECVSRALTQQPVSLPQTAIQTIGFQQPSKPLDFDRRLRAVAGFRQLDSAANLAAANKRIGNILRKAEDSVPDCFDSQLLVDAAEKSLADRLMELDSEIQIEFDALRYETGLEQLASLREPVDRFFDEVMVMVDDVPLRRNRLALLQQLHRMFLRVADISLLQHSPDKNR